MSSWLNKYIGNGVATILANGAILPQENALAFVAGTNVTLTAVDLPNAVPPQTQITIAASGSGGSGLSVVNSTTAAHPTLTAATWQLVLCNSSGGAYTQALPTSGLVAGQIVVLKDAAATSRTTGIWANAITISGGSNTVQNQHDMTTASTTYVWGQTNQDQGGDDLWLFWTGSAWQVMV